MPQLDGIQQKQRRRNRNKRRKNQRRGTLVFLLVVLLGVWLFFLNRQGEREAGIDLPHVAKDLPAFAADKTSWTLLLVNRDHPLPEDYEVERTTLDNGIEVDVRIDQALQEMFDAAREEGIYPVVGSGYRTTSKQQSIMDEKIEAYRREGYSDQRARTLAESWVALPGTSEHEMGLAVDINADKTLSTNDEVYGWLARNAHTYGFILRYPSDKTKLTGVDYEPWHYRYVGVEAAGDIHRWGLCLEEYLDALS